MHHTTSTFGLRLPAHMRDWIGQRAKRNRRSINGEIVHLLGAVQDRDGKQGGGHGDS